jgi:hypothetical protein
MADFAVSSRRFYFYPNNEGPKPPVTPGFTPAIEEPSRVSSISLLCLFYGLLWLFYGLPGSSIVFYALFYGSSRALL